jgi:hypothetical protein
MRHRTHDPKTAATAARQPLSAEDLEDLRILRGLADRVGAPQTCPEEACRRAGKCRGAHRPSPFFERHFLPPCFLDELEARYAPVAEWHAFRERLDAGIAAIAAAQRQAAERPPE